MDQSTVTVMFGFPIWFFESVIYPYKVGSLPYIAIPSVVSLIVGLLIGCLGRAFSLFLFIMPIAASHVFILSMWMLRDTQIERIIDWYLGAFLLAIVLTCVYLVYRNKSARTLRTHAERNYKLRRMLGLLITIFSSI